MAQFRIYSQSSSVHEMQKRSRDAERYYWATSLSHWIWLGWWIASSISLHVFHLINSFLTEFAMESVQVPLIYQTTTSCGVFILTETEILTTSRKDSSEAAYLSKFVSICLYAYPAYISLRANGRHILISLYHLHHLNLSMMKMKTEQQESSNALQILKGRLPSVMLQTFLVWMVKLLHVQLPMLLFWYVS